MILCMTIRCKARRCLGVFVCFLPYFFILSLFNAFWYFFALARFAFRVPRGAIFAGASRDYSLQSSPMPWCFCLFFALFLYFELVQCILVLFCIGIVFAQCLCKVVCAREVFLGAHVQVVVLLVVEYALKALLCGNAYGAWR